eukprot:2609421-Karenia_brevis.AAC.1
MKFVQWQEQLSHDQTPHNASAAPVSGSSLSGSENVARALSTRPPFSTSQDNATSGGLHREPSFNSSEWWASVISERLRNYEVATRRHTVEASQTPSNLSFLPEYRQPCGSRMNDPDAIDPQGNSSSQSEEALPDPSDFMD